MSTFNLGNVVGLIKSDTPPTKKFVLWAKILDLQYPNLVQLHYWDGDEWIPYIGSGALRPVITLGPVDPSTLIDVQINDSYLIPPTGAIGDWSGQENSRAEWNGVQWVFEPPRPGLLLNISDEEGTIRIFESGQWNILSTGDQWILPPPATSTSPGEMGDRSYDNDFIYVCVENNLWKRTNLDSFSFNPGGGGNSFPDGSVPVYKNDVWETEIMVMDVQVTDTTISITYSDGSIQDYSVAGNFIESSEKGQANGVAETDSNNKILNIHLPSFVDDVEEYADLPSFPTVGESSKIYVDIANNQTYRWSGTQYVPIGSSVALGETSSTAYRGDRGKIAYDHTFIVSGNPHGVTDSDVINGEENTIVLHDSSGVKESDLIQASEVVELDSIDHDKVDLVWKNLSNDNFQLFTIKGFSNESEKLKFIQSLRTISFSPTTTTTEFKEYITEIASNESILTIEQNKNIFGVLSDRFDVKMPGPEDNRISLNNFFSKDLRDDLSRSGVDGSIFTVFGGVDYMGHKGESSVESSDPRVLGGSPSFYTWASNNKGDFRIGGVLIGFNNGSLVNNNIDNQNARLSISSTGNLAAEPVKPHLRLIDPIDDSVVVTSDGNFWIDTNGILKVKQNGQIFPLINEVLEPISSVVSSVSTITLDLSQSDTFFIEANSSFTLDYSNGLPGKRVVIHVLHSGDINMNLVSGKYKTQGGNQFRLTPSSLIPSGQSDVEDIFTLAFSEFRGNLRANILGSQEMINL